MTIRQPGLLEKLGGLIPGYRGYADRDTRRTADQRLRARVGAILDEVKADLSAMVGRLTDAGRLGDIDAVDGLRRRLGTCADTIRNSPHGGGGMFDATTVMAADLDKVYAHDLGLHEQANALAAAVRAVDEGALPGSLTAARAAADKLQHDIAERETLLSEVFQCPS